MLQGGQLLVQQRLPLSSGPGPCLFTPPPFTTNGTGARVALFGSILYRFGGCDITVSGRGAARARRLARRGGWRSGWRVRGGG